MSADLELISDLLCEHCHVGVITNGEQTLEMVGWKLSCIAETQNFSYPTVRLNAPIEVSLLQRE
jgi:hypothetical protein